MFRNCQTRLRLVLFLVCYGVCSGADDDTEPIAPEIGQRLRVQPANAGTLLNQQRAQESLNVELRYKVDEFRANYDLNSVQQEKLSLAGRADVRRAVEISQKLLQAPKFRDVQRNLFGPDSFMAKAIPRILTDQQFSKYRADVDERLRLSHRSNIEGAIRAIERSVVLQIPQQEALVDLLICELPPPQSVSESDPLLVAYGVAKLPEESLKRLFDDDQWPDVQQVLENFQNLAPLLEERGLIDGQGKLKTPSAKPEGEQRAEPNEADPAAPNRKRVK